MQKKRKIAKPAAPRRASLHHSVAQDIGARILKGEFAPGSLLPNEAEWCVAYGVSRTAVREAIKMLMAKGLILSRPKIGSRVQPRGNWNLLDPDVLVWYCAAVDQKHFLTNMQQVRHILEPEAAALAALNRGEDQLSAIGQALDGMRSAESLAAWNVHDVRFHLAVLTATGNELLAPLGFVIKSALGNMFDYTARHNDNFRKALPLHEDIYTAIRRRNPEAARRAVRRLLDDTNSVIGLPKNASKPPPTIKTSPPIKASTGKTKGRKRHV